MKKEIGINSIGYLLIGCYALMLAWLSQSSGVFSFEISILLFLVIGLAALVRTREWAARLLVATGGAGIFYIILRLLIGRNNADFFPGAVFGMLSLTLMAFYGMPAANRRAFGLGLHPWTILVIDDDRALLKLLEMNFRRYGIFVLTAETGEKGLTMADKHKPDLIILDVILPKLKGRAVCARLKEDPKTKDIPVIFLTAKNSMDDVHAEMEAGAHAHITKPVDFKDLFSQVKKILSR